MDCYIPRNIDENDLLEEAGDSMRTSSHESRKSLTSKADDPDVTFQQTNRQSSGSFQF